MPNHTCKIPKTCTKHNFISQKFSMNFHNRDRNERRNRNKSSFTLDKGIYKYIVILCMSLSVSKILFVGSYKLNMSIL